MWGSGLEVLAALLYGFIIFRIFLFSANALETSNYFVLAAVIWFIIQTFYDGIYFIATTHAADPKTLLRLVSTWQAPLREIQIHGFGMLMVLGVSQKLFPRLFGWHPITRRPPLQLLFWAIQMGLAGMLSGLILMRLRGHAWAGLWYSGALLMAFATMAAVIKSRLLYFRASEDPFQNDLIKFIRFAFIWLFISLGLLVLLPAYMGALHFIAQGVSKAAKMGFSHAYYGAIRHAITVGFLTQMMMGVSSKLISTWKNNFTQFETFFPWAPFHLINLGCTIRVVGQIGTDFHSSFFYITPFSGVFEVTALGLWGFQIFKIIKGDLHESNIHPVI